MALDWLIIGGGIHGVHIAVRMMGEGKVDADRIRIVDPGKRLLDRWRSCTERTGMTYLRSPAVHHLDLSPWSLIDFGKQRKNPNAHLFAHPNGRPALGLFNDHCDKVIQSFDLSTIHICSSAVSCSVGCDGVAVELESGESLSAGRVVLAIGGGGQPQWPDWAPREDPRVGHVFAPDFESWPASPEVVAVFGGGISGAQIALRLAEEGHEVHLVSRHALREHQFDSEPGWLGPRFMTGFADEADMDRRRDIIAKARHKGSVPPDVRQALEEAIAAHQIHWYQSEVEGLDERGAEFRVNLTSGLSVDVQRVLLATGFMGRRPGGTMVDRLVESAALPCAQCGYPIVDKALSWHPRIYVSGPLAELELGPSARNIAGARRAAERLVEVARTSRATSSAGAP